MGFLTFISNIGSDIINYSDKDKQHHDDEIYGKWKIEKMETGKVLKSPEESSIIYQFNIDNTLIIVSPFKKAKRKFHTNKQYINFEGLGLFGTHKKFAYTISQNSMVLDNEMGFKVKLKRV